MLPPVLLALVAVLTATLAGCSGPGSSGAPADPGAPVSEPSPDSMERALADATRLLEEVRQALDEQLGPRRWRVVSPAGDLVVHTGCEPGQDPEGEIAHPPAQGFRGTYPESRWKEAARLALTLSRAHGLDTAVVLADHPGDFVVEAVARDGARLQLGFGDNTTLSVTTSCRRWDHRPAPGPIPLE